MSITPLAFLTPLSPLQSGGAANSRSSGPTTFGGLLTQAIQQLQDGQTQANQAVQQAITGTGSVTQAMTAMVAAQMSLDVATAFRNQALQAYQSVINMTID